MRLVLTKDSFQRCGYQHLSKFSELVLELKTELRIVGAIIVSIIAIHTHEYKLFYLIKEIIL